jgi:glyoxylase-like metal-dependent hydrolase (beta-lactamase superfamily II)
MAISSDSAPSSFERLRAPDDPRTGWGLPESGAMPVQARLDELVSRVLAPNPSAMSLDGTNTYLVGAPGAGEVVIVDPGPPAPEHFDRVRRRLADLDAGCALICVTHHHVDHAEAALPWAQALGCRVAAARGDVAGAQGSILSPGDRIDLAGTTISVVPTPGHSADHLAFRLESGAVLVGDHILGRGTSVVTHPEGDLLAYLESLRRVLDLGPSTLYPGHGPELGEDPAAVIRYYLAHRRFREEQILALLGERDQDVPALVRRIYAGVDPGLWPYAEQSTRAATEKLAAEGVVRVGADGTLGVAGAAS